VPKPRGVSAISLYTALGCVVMIAPIIIISVIAFGDQSYMRFPPQSYSLRWFRSFFYDSNWRSSLWSSVIVAAIASPIATVAGFLAAYSFLRGRLVGKKFVLSMILLPIIVPSVITAIAMYFLTVRLGLVGNLLWIGVCHSVMAIPLVVLISLSSLQTVDVNLERAALSLGASRMRMFVKVVVPIALPGLISAALFAFLSSFDELIISLFLGGVRTQTLPVRIWNSLLLQVEPVIAAASVFLIAVTGIIMLLETLNRRRLRISTGNSNQS